MADSTCGRGQNTAGASGMFDYTGISIMAAKNGTTVMIDINGNGTVDIVQTLVDPSMRRS